MADRGGTKQPRLVIIDDDVDLALAVRDTARPLGFDVLVVSDPRDAPVICEAFRPDVLVLDLALAVMNGVSVLKRLVIPRIVLVWGLPDSYQTIAKCLTLLRHQRSVSVLRKPFGQNELQALLRC